MTPTLTANNRFHAHPLAPPPTHDSTPYVAHFPLPVMDPHRSVFISGHQDSSPHVYTYLTVPPFLCRFLTTHLFLPCTAPFLPASFTVILFDMDFSTVRIYLPFWRFPNGRHLFLCLEISHRPFISLFGDFPPPIYFSPLRRRSLPASFSPSRSLAASQALSPRSLVHGSGRRPGPNFPSHPIPHTVRKIK